MTAAIGLVNQCLDARHAGGGNRCAADQPGIDKASTGVRSQTPSLQKNVASCPEAAFNDRSGVKRCGTPEIKGAILHRPNGAVAVAVVPPAGAAVNAMVGTEVQPKPWQCGACRPGDRREGQVMLLIDQHRA